MQPQVVLQMLTRLLRHDQSPGAVVSAPRWVLGDGGFDTWSGTGPDHVALEAGAPSAWADGLTARGHEVRTLPPDANVGHAHVISLRDGVLAGAADPRALTGAAAGC